MPKKKDNRQSWSRKDSDEERHKGSYDLDELKKSDDFKLKMTTSAVKRKYAVCFGYLGSRYQGLQINPPANGRTTVEAELERALFLAGTIDEVNFGYMQKVQWSRAARTDRGVHAASQCCAMKLKVNDRKTFATNVNSFLPNDIRVHTLTRVTKGFNSKMLCNRRKYNYLLPTYVVHDVNAVNTLLEAAFQRQGSVIGAGHAGGFVSEKMSKSLGPEHLEGVRQELLSYRIDDEKLALLRKSLQKYEGTHRYHNFTTGKTYNDPESKRHMLSFEASDPFIDTNNGGEWVMLSVVGQSFLLNQIRKMVTLAVEIARGNAEEGLFEDAVSQKQVDIAMSPGLGLYLDELYFDGYNMKQRQQSVCEKKALEKALLKEQERSKDKQGDTSSLGNEAIEMDGDKEDTESLRKKPRLQLDDDDKLVLSVAEQRSSDELQKGDNDADEPTEKEVIEWSLQAEIKLMLDGFAMDTIRPHVYHEEASSLQFLYFLDYLRAFPPKYSVTAKERPEEE